MTLLPYYRDENGFEWGVPGHGKTFPVTPLNLSEDYRIDAEVEVAEAIMYGNCVLHREGFIEASKITDSWFNVRING